jgi:Protein of unknown function (DUF3108)
VPLCLPIQRLIALSALLSGLAGICMQAASAQTQIPSAATPPAKLEAEYTAYLAGLPIGKGTWTVDIDDLQFSASASGGTTGLIRVFAGGQGTTTARGNLLNGGQPAASTYAATIKTAHKTDEVHLTVNNGAAQDIRVDPPVDNDPERVPMTDALRQGIVDPVTASLIRMPGTGELVGSQVCQRSVSIFDGRLRYDLQLAFKRFEKVKADKGYAGPVVVCAVYFTPVAGYIPSRATVKYLTEMRDMEVWMAPIAGTRVLAPYRFQAPTPIGTARLEADQFVVMAQPRTAKGAKTQ